MAVEVVDWFQFENESPALQRPRWEALPSRVEANVDRLLTLFASRRVTATFFVLAWLADRIPEVVQKIAAAGHEIASMGYNNLRIDRQQPAEFLDDLICSKAILENLTGREVTGYRAPGFSLTDKTPWAHAAIAEAGYRYSCSVQPRLVLRKNAATTPRFPYRIKDDLLEIPQNSLRLLGRAVPLSSATQFRMLPYPVTRWMMRRFNEREQTAMLFHLRAWEIDPDQPQAPGLRFAQRMAHYRGLVGNFERLDRLLQDHTWGRVDDTFAEQISSVPIWSHSRMAPPTMGFPTGLLAP